MEPESRKCELTDSPTIKRRHLIVSYATGRLSCQFPYKYEVIYSIVSNLAYSYRKQGLTVPKQTLKIGFGVTLKPKIKFRVGYKLLP